MSLFIQKENINMLWDVISDEPVFQFLPKDAQLNIYQLFLNNLQGFYETEKKKTTSMIDINKKYIVLILSYIKNNFPVTPNKITIHNEPPAAPKSLITFEEIQNDKKNVFQQELHRKQEEFDEFINVKVPPVPEFADKHTDAPIQEMDKILKEMQLQRNYDIEQINYRMPPPLSQEKKTVSFSENVTQIPKLDSDDTLFSKLKKIPVPASPIPTPTTEDRIVQLENEVKSIHAKIDQILDLLRQ